MTNLIFGLMGKITGLMFSNLIFRCWHIINNYDIVVLLFLL